MSDKFSMTTGQAHELAMAFGRNGWTNADVKRICKGDMLTRILKNLHETYGVLVNIFASLTSFVANDHFVVGTDNGIKSISDGFKMRFLHKTEEPQAEHELLFVTLDRRSEDRMRGEVAETTLHDIFFLISEQKTGESGALDTDGENVFVVKDCAGKKGVVVITWMPFDANGHYGKDCGWYIELYHHNYLHERSLHNRRAFFPAA